MSNGRQMMIRFSDTLTYRLILLWFFWIVILVAFQYVADFRFDLSRPDNVLPWTGQYTGKNCQPFIDCPLLHHQFSWDSGMYAGIAQFGYADTTHGSVIHEGEVISINYAFFPFYPFLIATFSPILTSLGINNGGATALIGIATSLLGTLGALLAITDLTRDTLDEKGRFRTAYYILIFPTAFFLSAVYSEGLFLGLILSCFAMLKRKKFLVAGFLAMLATWTRATGALLIIPFIVSWVQNFGWSALWSRRQWLQPDLILQTIIILAPVIAYLIWRIAFGEKFEIVEDQFFNYSLFTPQRSIAGWVNAVTTIISGSNSATRIYYLMEFASVGLVLISSIGIFRRYTGIALFSLFAIMISSIATAPQSYVRYALTAPSVFLFLSHLGEHDLFDKLWSFFSILMLGLMVILFSAGFWIA
jgi:hypothetical protein